MRAFLRALPLTRLLRGVSVVALASALASVPGARAQNAAVVPVAGEIRLDEISVTGEKVTRSLQETASSVTVVTRDQIENNVRNSSVTGELFGTPNVNFPSAGGLGGAPVIRGQDSEGPNSGANAFFGGTTPRTVVNIDGHLATYYELVYATVPLWDLKSIEVFRGPQTVSQGANSIAGAILIRTNDPTFVPEGRIQAASGSRAYLRGSAMLNAPITDEFAVRLALDYYQRENFITYINPAFNGAGTSPDLTTSNVRFKTLWLPSALPGFEAKLTVSHTFNNQPTFEAATRPFARLDSIVTSAPTFSNNSNFAVLDLKYDFGNTVRVFNQLQYADVFTKRYTAPFNNGSATDHPRNLSNESRVTFGDPLVNGFSGLAGYYAYTTDTTDTLNLRGLTRYSDARDSLGIFGELSYRFLDQWTLTGSLRYQQDDVNRVGVSPFAREGLDYHRTFNAVLPRATLAYDVTRDLTVGALYTEGYNPGGVTLNLVSQRYVPYKQESARDYELFTRARLLDDRMFLTSNLFYTEYKNGQRYIDAAVVGGFVQAFTVNVDASRAYGAEIAAEYLVLDNLRVRGGIGLLNTEITRYANTAASLQGKQFARAPALNGKISAEWEIVPSVTLLGRVRYQDDYFSDDVNNPLARIKSYTVADVQATWNAGPNARVFTFVNNIFDDRSVTFQRLTRTTPTLSFYEGAVVQPREIGGGVEFRF